MIIISMEFKDSKNPFEHDLNFNYNSDTYKIFQSKAEAFSFYQN
jgi:hypothetical protein